MRRLTTVILMVLALAASADAASVELQQFPVAGGMSLRLRNSLDIDLGAIVLLVSGTTGFSFAADPAISVSDSGYFYDPGTDGRDALVVAAPYNSTLVPAHSDLFLGTLQLAAGSSFAVLYPGDDLTGVSLLAPNLDTIFYETFTNAPCHTENQDCAPLAVFTVPEPASLSLLGSLGAFAALYLGGNRRRRNASVGAPT